MKLRISLRIWKLFTTGSCSQCKPCNLVVKRGGRNRIGRREKWPRKSWEEGEIGGKSREEGEKEKLGVGRNELDVPG